MSKITVCVSTQLFEGTTLSSVMPSYQRLLERLHGNGWSIDPRIFRRILEDQNEIVVFVRKDKEILATAQASLGLLLPKRPVFISNIIALEEQEGDVYRRLALDRLEETARKKWKNENWPYYLTLTDVLNKKNSGFYESCGYQARTVEDGNPSVVWVKEG